MILAQRRYFDNIADVFDTRYNVYLKPAGRWRVKRRSELFLRHCQLRPGLRILEIGSGTGEYSRSLLKYHCRLFCLDYSDKMLKIAIGKLARQGNVHFLAGDIEQLALKDNTFDAVLGNAILHHLNLQRALPEILRILRPGAGFAFSEPNMLNPQIFLQKHIKLLKIISGDTLTESAFVRWQIKAVLQRTGFREVWVQPFDFLHPYTPAPLLNLVNRMGLVLEKIPIIREIAGSLLISGIK